MISFILLSFIDITKYFPDLNFDNILTLAYNATNLCNNGNFYNPPKKIFVFSALKICKKHYARCKYERKNTNIIKYIDVVWLCH